MKKSILLSVGAMVFATSALAGKEEKVQWSELPAAVQKTITDNAGRWESRGDREGNKIERR